MARGFPDYFGRSIWPKYGTATSKIGTSVNVASGDTDTIFSLSGMGVIKWLKVGCALELDYGSSFFRLTIDGSVIDALHFYYGVYSSIIPGGGSLWGVTIFDLLLQTIRVESGLEIPFHDSVVVELYNAAAAQVSAGGSALYYIVE